MSISHLTTHSKWHQIKGIEGLMGSGFPNMIQVSLHLIFSMQKLLKHCLKDILIIMIVAMLSEKMMTWGRRGPNPLQA